MEKKKEIAKNISSGAEKVERIETEKTGENTTKTRAKKSVNSNTGRSNAKKTVRKTTAKKTEKAPVETVEMVEKTTGSTGEKAKRESERAKKRVELALKRKQAQAEKAEKRKAEKAARRKQAEEKRAAKRRKTAEKKSERAKRKQEAAAKREAKRKELAERRKARSQQRNGDRSRKKTDGKKRRVSGYGGWLAAVVSLGAITLALSTVVTLGAVDMAGLRRGANMNYRGTLYEFVGVMDNLDDDLDRVRVSASPAQQSRILTDLLVQARVAETDLEKLPVEGEADRNLTSFINRTAAEAERLLSKLRNGGTLDQKDAETLEGLYQTNHAVREYLDKLSAELTDKDMQGFLKGAKSKIGETLKNIENATLPENGKLLPSFWEMKGAGMSRTTTDQDKKDTKIASETAESRVKGYFSDYAVRKVEYTGETVSKGQDAYNFILTDKDGGAIYAQVSEFDGSLLRFDYYKDCRKQNFDLGNAQTIAETFMDKLGYENMTVVRSSESGATADFLFVYEANGYVFYPEAVKVKVCEERGVVSGFDASAYARNAKRRIEPSVKLTLEQAEAKLHSSLTVSHARPCVIDVKGRERTAYEFLCAYGDSQYVIYLDGQTGNEISIVNLENLR